MPDSLFSNLLHTLDGNKISEIARALGSSEQCVSKCMNACIAATLGGVAARAENLGELWKIIDLAPSHSGEVHWSHVADHLSARNSPIPSGNRALSGIFGGSERAVADSIGRDCGLPAHTVAVLLSLTVPIVMTSIHNRVRGEAMCMRSFSNLLHRETPAIRSALPPGVTALLWPQLKPPPNVTPTAPNRQREFPVWAFPLALMAVTLGCYWALTHSMGRNSEISSSATGSASRLATDLSDEDLAAPDVTIRHLPEYGPEADLLALIQDPAAPLSTASRIEFYNLPFVYGRATLQPQATGALNNIVKILHAYTNVHVKIWGRADEMGNPSADLKLAHMRAEKVKAELTLKGITPDRLTTDAFDERSPSVHDLSERCVAIEITEK